MVYLLHFHRALGDPDNPRGQAQHYIGWCAGDVENRLAEHRAGNGAAITAYLAEHNIGFVLARVWIGDSTLERRLKNRKEAPALCPICSPNTWHTRAACYGPSWVPGIPVTFEPIKATATAPAGCPF